MIQSQLKISFCKVAFAIKDVKMTKTWLPYPHLAPYNIQEED